MDIKATVASIQQDIRNLENSIERKLLELKHVRNECPHSWTNNDGDGQFIVERCDECGLQKDGGLRCS